MSRGDALAWSVSAVGALVVLTVLRDIFHTLLHPTGHGALSRAVMRAAWRVARRSGRTGMQLAGPFIMLAVIASWATLTVLGWALVYLPHVPDSFSYSSGLDPAARSPLVDAVYVSLVVVSTLGLGDVVPTTGWLRVVTPIEALTGFALLTAAVTWVLQVYPALARRRALAVRLRLLTEAAAAGSETDGAALAPAAAAATAHAVAPGLLHALAAELVAVRVDLAQYSETYYFHDGPAISLARALPDAVSLAQAATASADPDRRLAGSVLLRAIDELVTVLDESYLGTGGDRDTVLRAYGADHDQRRP